ncbi:MAG TPA: SDR family NAD(P)-dependent oxidoreductase [Spongiibacteraceae bacterium]|nr:SDR family NAD(P)-dependent oxidoreductase [Spongiibacteraceae bacterium]
MTIPADFLAKYGPWALVTGASSGIGEQFARLLAKQGFNLLLVARRADKLAALQAELLQQHGAKSEVIAEDLADPTAIDRIIAIIDDRDLGLIISNAGFGLKGALNQHDRALVDAMLNVNARAPLMLIHSLLPKLRLRKNAGIILTGSQEGEAAFPWSSAYAATKSFVHGLGLSLYGELHGTGVDVLVLAPGSTETEAPILQGISRDALFGVMSAQEVARQGLENLGRRPLHIPAWYNRLLVHLLRALPRRWSIAMAGKGMADTLARSGNPVKK